MEGLVAGDARGAFGLRAVVFQRLDSPLARRETEVHSRHELAKAVDANPHVMRTREARRLGRPAEESSERKSPAAALGGSGVVREEVSAEVVALCKDVGDSLHGREIEIRVAVDKMDFPAPYLRVPCHGIRGAAEVPEGVNERTAVHRAPAGYRQPPAACRAEAHRWPLDRRAEALVDRRRKFAVHKDSQGAASACVPAFLPLSEIDLPTRLPSRQDSGRSRPRSRHRSPCRWDLSTTGKRRAASRARFARHRKSPAPRE